MGAGQARAACCGSALTRTRAEPAWPSFRVRARLYSLLKNSTGGGFVTRARLQPGRKCRKMSVGFSPCRVRPSIFAAHLHFFSKLFSRAGSGIKSTGLYTLRINSTVECFVTGHEFTRADKANKMNWALAPAKLRFHHERPSWSFSAASLAPANPPFAEFAPCSDSFSATFPSHYLFTRAGGFSVPSASSFYTHLLERRADSLCFQCFWFGMPDAHKCA